MIKATLSWNWFEVYDTEDGKDAPKRFEDLCRQLFANEFISSEATCKQYLQAAVNNPGIETAPIYSEKEKKWMGFQAKYFKSRVDYSDIYDSCDKAVKYYKGKLDELVLLCNLHPSPRAKKFEEAKNFLKANGITLNVIAGDAILDRVRKYDYLKEYYFGLHQISDTWIKEHDRNMMNVLSNRFEAGLNVDTRYAELLSLFSQDNSSIEFINKKKEDLLKEIDSIYWHQSSYQGFLTRLYKAVETLSDVQYSNIPEAFLWYESISQEFQADLDAIKNEIAKYEQQNEELRNNRQEDTVWRNEYIKKHEIINNLKELVCLPDILSFSDLEKNLIIGKILFVSGKAGSGKSHLLAHETDCLLKEGRSPLLFLAGMYTDNQPIQNQIMGNCQLNFHFKELIDILDAKGAEKGKPIIIFIDALNETDNRALWKTQLPSLLSQIEKSSFIKIVLSYRDEYGDDLLSDEIKANIRNGKICHFEHKGFEDITLEAARSFFNSYGVPFGLTEFFEYNMSNPLFLKLYCKTYDGNDVSLPELYERLISRANENIIKNMSSSIRNLGYLESCNLLQPLIDELAQWFATNGKRFISQNEILNLKYWTQYKITPIPFLKRVIDEGILITFRRNDSYPEDVYCFTFDQMNDYFIARAIVNSSISKDEIRLRVKEDVLTKRNGILDISACDLFVNICALYKKRFNEECINILDSIEDVNKDYFIDRFIQSFKWRQKEAIDKKEFCQLLKKYDIQEQQIYDVLIHNSTKRKHPLNSEFLHSILYPLHLNERDYLWTLEINEPDNIYPRVIELIELYDSGDKLGRLDGNQAELLLILFSWFLTTTNRNFRDRTSKVMIEILKVDFDLCLPILMKFEGVNDPYIIQRLYGVVFGACSKRTEPHEKGFQKLAEYIYKTVFSSDEVYPDILLRDYARLTIELFLAEHPGYYGLIDKTRIAPPYHSAPILQIGEDFSKDSFSEEHYGSSCIKSSMALEELGWYGDFGRYVFERALKQFDVDMLNLYNYAIAFIRDVLGYKDDLFAKSDKYISHTLRHYSSSRIERIGKKYQWIAFYNILARVSDNCQMISSGFSDYNRDKPKYGGPWNPYVRDFDPTLNDHFLASADVPQFSGLGNYFKQSKADCFNNDISDQEWLASYGFFLEKIGENLIQKDENGTRWVILDGYFDPERDSRIQNSHTQWALLHAFFIPEKAFSVLSKTSCWKRSFPWQILHRHDAYTLFNREYPWSISCNELQEEEMEKPLFDLEADGKKIQIEFSNFLHATNKFLWEEEYDYSKKEPIKWAMPCTKLVKELGLHREKCDTAFYDKEHRLAAFDLRFSYNSEAVALRQNLLKEFLMKTKMRLVWFVQAEKSIQDEETRINKSYNQLIGFYSYNGKKVLGEITV